MLDVLQYLPFQLKRHDSSAQLKSSNRKVNRSIIYKVDFNNQPLEITAKCSKNRIDYLMEMYEIEQKSHGKRKTPSTLKKFLTRWDEVISVDKVT